ncbi:hypothetical protein Tsubulata_011390, partial [Turnera subulata]
VIYRPLPSLSIFSSFLPLSLPPSIIPSILVLFPFSTPPLCFLPHASSHLCPLLFLSHPLFSPSKHTSRAPPFPSSYFIFITTKTATATSEPLDHLPPPLGSSFLCRDPPCSAVATAVVVSRLPSANHTASSAAADTSPSSFLIHSSSPLLLPESAGA